MNMRYVLRKSKI